MQQPTKIIELAVYTNFLYELNIIPNLIFNTHAEKIFKEVYNEAENEEEIKSGQGKSEK